MLSKEENLFTPDCIRTYTGIYINVFEPTPEMICIEDIAHALANQCRFGGHLPRFYSVAQHSGYVCALVDDDNAFSALMHDASEAYLMDIPRPIKKRLRDYKEIEDGLMRVIADKFGFEYPMNTIIKEADEQMLQLEWDCLMLGKNSNIQPFEWYRAKEFFMNQFKLKSQLTRCH